MKTYINLHLLTTVRLTIGTGRNAGNKSCTILISKTREMQEVEMMANGHKCHITMATGGPGQQGGDQHPGASGQLLI